MKIPKRQQQGKVSASVILIVILCIAVGGLYLKLNQPDKTSVESPEPEEVVKEEVAVIPEVKEIKKPVEKIVEKPVEKTVEKPAEKPVEKKLTEVDIYLAKEFPMPTFKPLEEVVKNWKAVPQKAFPEETVVNVDLNYADAGRKVTKKHAAGHRAKPLKLTSGVLTVASLESPKLRSRVNINKTDFKKAVLAVYKEKIELSRQKVLAKRESHRAAAESHLARLAAGDPPVVEEEDESSDQQKISAVHYGKKFRGDYWPKTKNGKNSEIDHEVPMGAIGGVAAVMYNEREARIVDLWEKGPGAKAGLQKDDVLVAVNGKRFSVYGKSNYDGATGVPEELGNALIEAQAEGDPLELTVRRDEDQIDIEVDLPVIPDFAKKFPADCARSKVTSQSAAAYLLEQANHNGLLRANDYTNAWFGMALLATGDPKYSRQIKTMARHFGEKYDLGKNPSDKELINGGEGKGASSNWFVCTVGMFLGEYYLATEDKSVLRALTHCCRSMDIRVHPKNGRMGHGRDMHSLPYGGKGLVIINVHAHIMWALTANIEGLENWDWDSWKLSYKCVQTAISDNGSVGYNFSARGGSQCTPRTGAMLIALKLAGKEKAQIRDMGKWLAKNNQVFPDVHAMTFIGPIFGFTGLRNTSESNYRKVMDNYRWLFSITQPVNFKQGSYYFGDRKNSGGDEYCNKRYVGNIMSIYLLNSHRSDTLWMLGNREKKWYK